MGIELFALSPRVRPGHRIQAEAKSSSHRQIVPPASRSCIRRGTACDAKFTSVTRRYFGSRTAFIVFRVTSRRICFVPLGQVISTRSRAERSPRPKWMVRDDWDR